MSTLNKQIWVDQIMEKFYPDASFLKYARDFTAFVNYDIINMADAGVDPDVLVNNTAYPITIVDRVDMPISFELDKFETVNTKVSNPEAIELSYDKMESMIFGHRNALQSKTGQKAAHAYAPTQDTEKTPVIETSGGDNGHGFKRLVSGNILALKRRFDNLDIPMDKRYLVLCPEHLEDLMIEDLKAFKDITDFANGKPKRFAGFNILEFSKTAKYDSVTKRKKAFSTIYEPENDSVSSFAFNADEVMKADGSAGMYLNERDPEQRATIIGFDKRFVAMPIRNKGIGSIISAKI